MKIKINSWSWYFWAILALIDAILAYSEQRYGLLSKAELFEASFLFCVGMGLFSFLNPRPK